MNPELSKALSSLGVSLAVIVSVYTTGDSNCLWGLLSIGLIYKVS